MRADSAHRVAGQAAKKRKAHQVVRRRCDVARIERDRIGPGGTEVVKQPGEWSVIHHHVGRYSRSHQADTADAGKRVTSLPEILQRFQHHPAPEGMPDKMDAVQLAELLDQIAELRPGRKAFESWTSMRTRPGLDQS